MADRLEGTITQIILSVMEVKLHNKFTSVGKALHCVSLVSNTLHHCRNTQHFHLKVKMMYIIRLSMNVCLWQDLLAGKHIGLT